MIITSPSRLVIRQDPDTTASLAGVALACFGCVEMLTTAAVMVGSYAATSPVSIIVPAVRFTLGALFVISGWLFLRGRSRVVIDRAHRMVARYLGVGGYSAGGNRTWDLDDFECVTVAERKKRAISGAIRLWHVVFFKRRDGGSLDIYWAQDHVESVRVALSSADFAGLPYVRGNAD